MLSVRFLTPVHVVSHDSRKVGPVKVLVVGQTPPPFHGQSIMIEKLITARFHHVELHHVRMAFSQTIDDVGRLRPGKLFHLASVIWRIFTARFRYGITVLCYPPAGPNRIPMYRDMAILLMTRPLFKHTVFHFHAGGLTELLPHLSLPERLLFSRAFSRPDCAILLSDLNPPEGERLHSQRTLVIPYGIEDNFPHYDKRDTGRRAAPTILFVGVLRASKGVMVLLKACRLLRDRALDFNVQLVGQFDSKKFEIEARTFVAMNELKDQITFLGVLTGHDKWQVFADADVFCFPSFYECETFGLVVLEAMQFTLPVVAARWRGIPSLIRDGETGYLVPPQDPEAVARRLETLLKQPKTARKMGQRGRKLYLKEFSLERWRRRMENAFLTTAGLHRR